MNSKYFRLLTLCLSIITTILSAIISFGYIILTVTSINGIILAAIMSMSSLIVTTTTIYANINTDKTNNKKKNAASQTYSTLIDLYFYLLIPLIAINGISTFVGAYQSFLLLSAALLFTSTLPALVIPVIAILVGSIALLGNILYTSKICYELYNKTRYQKVNIQMLNIDQPLANFQQANIMATEKVIFYDYQFLHNIKESRERKANESAAHKRTLSNIV